MADNCNPLCLNIKRTVPCCCLLHNRTCHIAASEYIYNKYKDVKTCDVIEEDELDGYKKVAEPIGVIAGVEGVQE
jgi:hypothetical protein